MLCSICSEEFESVGVDCPVCGCGLVPSSLSCDVTVLPNRRQQGPLRLVELCRPGSYPVAMMIKQTLEQNGIPVMIPGGNALSIMPHLAFSGELRVLVEECNASQAREIYDAYFAGEESIDYPTED
jgi:hypothetical protein